MLKIIAAGGLALLFLAALSGCGSSPQPPENKITNAELAQKVRAQLNSDPDVAAARLTVDTDASQNLVTLAGTAASEELRAKAVSLAQGAVPGLSVKDAIQVTAPPVVETPKPAAKKPVRKSTTTKKPTRRRR